MSAQQITISTQNLTRTFKSYTKAEGLKESLKGFFNRQHVEKVALKPTTLQIRGGQIVGLVGANGAGKTTLLKLLSGLIHPSSGEAFVLGFKPHERNPDLLRSLSLLLGQKAQLWWDLSPVDSFRLLAEIYDLDRSTVQKRIQELAERLQCGHVLETQLRRLSLGERMKMEMIGALLHQPKILFLDEPTIGLDIVAQASLRDFLKSYVQDYSPTVILTSHYMEDISYLADQLLLISQGGIVYNGTVTDFTTKTGNKGLTESLVKISWVEGLQKQVDLGPYGQLQLNQTYFEAPVKTSDLSDVLRSLTQAGNVQSLKIEESDFESVIHQFLSGAKPL